MRTNKLLNGIIAFVLAGALAAGVCCMGFASRGNDGKWFGNFKNISTWHWSDKTDENNSDNPDDKPVVGDTDNNGGALIGGVENNGISLMSARIAPTAYAENGISPQADTAYSLTATIVPDYASNKAVDWSVSWVNANSAFASGKTVTDYVTVTPTSDGALTANVVCKQAFGEQIQIIVTSRDNSNVTAVCLLDYAKRITGVSFTLIGDSGKVGTISSSTTSIKVTDYTDLTLFLNPIYEYSVYTLDSDFTRETDLNYSTGVYTALSNAGLSLKTLSGTVAHSNQSQGRISWSFSCYTFGTMALTDSISSNIENDIVYGENEYPTLVNKFVSAQKNYGDTWGVLKMSVTSSVTGRVYRPLIQRYCNANRTNCCDYNFVYRCACSAYTFDCFKLVYSRFRCGNENNT